MFVGLPLVVWEKCALGSCLNGFELMDIICSVMTLKNPLVYIEGRQILEALEALRLLVE